MAETDDAPTGGPAGPAGRDTSAATGDGPPDPVRDTRSDDDRDLGWGDDLDRADRSGERDARWYEEQRPPHWE